ncbi:MAG: aminopeptidase [Candidatus Diapherotrites archaeon]|nr:aminopeptidase [Candidatus Diapherotrites archaeon]
MRIGLKENKKGIAKARRKYKRFVDWMLRRDEFTLDEAKKVRKDAEKILEELQDVDFGPLVLKKGRKYKVKKTVGHSVLIACNPANKELALEVERQCWRNGAHTIMLENTAKRVRDSYVLCPLESLTELSDVRRALATSTDYVIHIDSVESEFWKKGVPAIRFKLHAPVSQRVYQLRDRNKERWVYVGWPHPQIARELRIPPKRFKRIMFNAIKWSYDKRTIALIERYHKAFDGSDEIHIVCDKGTDFTFSTKGRRYLKDDGILSDEDIKNNDIGMNIPAGEVFVAPVENSAEGSLYIPETSLNGYGVVKGLMLHFSKGEVVDYKAKRNGKLLDRFFKENTGAIRRIAEFGIGCNRGAEYTNGYILIDEKILGTIHIAVGWNIGYGGKNQASAHHDFIKPIYKGKVYADGKLLIDKGKFVG